jgi:hypothetical protein
MKNYLVFLGLFLPLISLACTCFNQTLNEDYNDADFIAKVKVLKKYNNEPNSEFYKVDIEIENLYKGNSVESIYIYGLKENGQDSACHVVVDENERLVVYGKMNTKGLYSINMCPRILRLDNSSPLTQKRHEIQMDILTILKGKNYGNFINSNHSEETLMFFREVGEIKLKENFAIYELTFDNELDVKCVKNIKKFKHPINKKIKKFLKEKKWYLKRNVDESLLKKKNKYFIVVYHNKKDDDGSGYLSQRLLPKK